MLFPFLEFAAPVSVYMSRTEFTVMKEHTSQFSSMTLEGILKNIWTTVGVCSTEEVRHAGCSAHEAAGVFFFFFFRSVQMLFAHTTKQCHFKSWHIFTFTGGVNVGEIDTCIRA